MHARRLVLHTRTMAYGTEAERPMAAEYRKQWQDI